MALTMLNLTLIDRIVPLHSLELVKVEFEAGSP